MSTVIRYSPVGLDIRVYMGGRRVGTIMRSPEGWRYFPKGSKVSGEPHHSLEFVKHSLEDCK